MDKYHLELYVFDILRGVSKCGPVGKRQYVDYRIHPFGKAVRHSLSLFVPYFSWSHARIFESLEKKGSFAILVWWPLPACSYNTILYTLLVKEKDESAAGHN